MTTNAHSFTRRGSNQPPTQRSKTMCDTGRKRLLKATYITDFNWSDRFVRASDVVLVSATPCRKFHFDQTQFIRPSVAPAHRETDAP